MDQESILNIRKIIVVRSEMKKLKKGDIAYINDGLGRKMYVEIISIKDNGEYGILEIGKGFKYTMPSIRNVIEIITAKDMVLRYLKEKNELEKKYYDLESECKNLHYEKSLQENEIYRLEKKIEKMKKLVENIKKCPMLTELMKEDENV